MFSKLHTLYIFYFSMIKFNSNATYINIIKSSNNIIIVSIMHNVITTKILPKIFKVDQKDINLFVRILKHVVVTLFNVR